MQKKVDFGPHSLLKIEILKSHGFDISMETLENIIRFPDIIEKGYKGRLVAQGGIDDSHVVRVVYETRPENLYVVTLYPGRRSRYEKD